MAIPILARNRTLNVYERNMIKAVFKPLSCLCPLLSVNFLIRKLFSNIWFFGADDFMIFF